MYEKKIIVITLPGSGTTIYHDYRMGELTCAGLRASQNIFLASACDTLAEAVQAGQLHRERLEEHIRARKEYARNSGKPLRN